MLPFKPGLSALFLCLALAAPCVAADNKDATYDDPAAARKDADFNVQGEYAGEVKDGDSMVVEKK